MGKYSVLLYGSFYFLPVGTDGSYSEAHLLIPEGSITYTRRLNCCRKPPTPPSGDLKTPPHATFGQPSARPSASFRPALGPPSVPHPMPTHSTPPPPPLTTTHPWEGLSAGRQNARAPTRMGRGTGGLTLPAALRLLRRLHTTPCHTIKYKQATPCHAIPYK
jgi:hypothetical protein